MLDRNSWRSRKCRYGAAGLTPAIRGIGKGESGRAFFRDQPERRLQQRLLQIAVVIAALGAALFLVPAHVKGFYMSRAQRSLGTKGWWWVSLKWWVLCPRDCAEYCT